MGIAAVVLGATGFGGAELLRMLERHPEIHVVGASGSSRAGQEISELYPHLRTYRNMGFISTSQALEMGPDIVFSSLPFGESMELFGDVWPDKVVDVSGDFRLRDPFLYERWYGRPHRFPEALTGWSYGLSEVHRREIASATKVANPGCYPTAALLALIPLVRAGALESSSIFISGLSGISGAGRAGGEGFDFSTANESARPYSPVGHKHIPEIEQELNRVDPSGRWTVSFVPHLVPMTRGVITTCFAKVRRAFGQKDLIAVLQEAYKGEPFVAVTDAPQTGRLMGTNNAELAVRVDDRTGTVVAIGAIDNLGKGAAGQAVQNANLMFGFEETLGLLSSGMYP